MKLITKRKRKEWHREIRRLRELRYQIKVLANLKMKTKFKPKERLKKIDELIQKAEKKINIICSSNSLSRLILHKELLQEAKNKGVTISVGSVISKEFLEEVSSLDFCNIREMKNTENNFLSIDNKECLIIEPIPDDDNLVYGRDLGMWISSQSFTKFMDEFFNSNFEKARKLFPHLEK